MNLLYQLDPMMQADQRHLEPPKGSMGKLDIKWRTPLGDVGRLQTQQIVVSNATKDFELQVTPSVCFCFHQSSDICSSQFGGPFAMLESTCLPCLEAQCTNVGCKDATDNCSSSPFYSLYEGAQPHGATGQKFGRYYQHRYTLCHIVWTRLCQCM